MVDHFMTRDDANKYVAAARRLRDGLDRYAGMMSGLSAAFDTIAADCEALAFAVPAEAIAVREIVAGLRGVLQATGDSMRGYVAGVQDASDQLSKIIRVTELEIRKGSSQ